MTEATCTNTECQFYNQSVGIMSVRDASHTFQNYACEWCNDTIAEVDITWAAGEGPEPDET